MASAIIHEPLRDKIFENLKDSILEGEFVPDERLNLGG